MKIEDKKVAYIHYTLKDAEGEIIDTSDGDSPLAYIQGMQNIVPGLEKELEGKVVGDKLSAVIPPEEAYGVRNEELVKTASLADFEDPEHIQEGAQFHVETPEGVNIATIVAIDGDNVVLDLNHPLVDETLYFDVEVTEIREPTEEELEHGHVHGPEGHDHEEHEHDENCNHGH